MTQNNGLTIRETYSKSSLLLIIKVFYYYLCFITYISGLDQRMLGLDYI
jgi:hypothetical protein